jgi:hypothetical protein
MPSRRFACLWRSAENEKGGPSVLEEPPFKVGMRYARVNAEFPVIYGMAAIVPN